MPSDPHPALPRYAREMKRENRRMMGVEITMTVAVKPSADPKAMAVVDELVRRGRAAMTAFANADQARVDEAVTALAWALYNPAHAKELAELAVKDTQLGNVPDKIIKKQRKTFGTLRDLLRVKTVGIIEEDKKLGIVKYAKPVGLVCAITPSTNPGATPVNKAMMAIKGRNAVIIASSPAGMKTTGKTVDYMRAELKKIGLPEDLVQILPPPASKDMTQALMQAADLVVATGSQDNVRRAYSSGTPAIGVGTGNVPVIVDETADLDDAARKICASKIFDNSTSCSSENSVILVDAIYDKAIAALERAGGYMASAAEKEKIQAALWPDGKLSRTLIARDADVLARGCGLPAAAESKKFFMVAETGVGRTFPFSGEKLALVLTVYRAKDFDDAAKRAREILDHQGRGHSRRSPYQGHGPRAQVGGRHRRGARVDQPGAHIRQRRRLRQRAQFHAQHGLRHLGRQQHHGQPELQELHQHHPSRHHHSGRSAERGRVVRRLLEEVREVAPPFRRHRATGSGRWPARL